MKVHFFEQPIFPINLCVVLEANGSGMAEVFDCSIGEVDDIINTSLAAVSLLKIKETNHFCVVLYTSKKKMDGSLIAHEATHYANQLLNYIGEQEVLAYLTGYAYKCVEEAQSHNKMVKKDLKTEDSAV